MHRPLTLPLATALTAVVLALAGCGDDRPERADTVAGEPAAPSEAAAAPAGNGETLTKKQAKAALLTVKDLPSGWSKSTEPGDGSESKTQPARCAQVFYALDKAAKPVAKAEIKFEQGFQALQHSVASFNNDTEGLVTQTAEAFSKCSTFTSIEPSGAKYEAKLSPLSFPNLGDRTLAVRMTASGGGTEFIADVVLVAVGHNAVSIVAGGLVPVPGSDVEAIARKAVAKLG